MGEGDDNKFKTELDYLETTIEALKETINFRIMQEADTRVKDITNLKELLNALLRPLEEALRHHCGEQRLKEEHAADELQRLRDQVQRVHERVDELLKLLSAGGLPERIARIEVAVASLVEQLTPVELPAAAPVAAGPKWTDALALIPLVGPWLMGWLKKVLSHD